MPTASGKHAYGICDKTGFRYKLSDLVFEVKNGSRTGMRVGKDVADQDHPQNFVGRVRVTDSQSLLNARPNRTEPDVINLLSDNPFTTGSAGGSTTTVSVSGGATTGSISGGGFFASAGPVTALG